MRHTKNETQHQTLTRLIKATDTQKPVTITYTKADGSETIRTIEIYDITVTAAGYITLKAMDRETSEARTWRLDRIASYTVHHATFTIQRPADDESKQSPTNTLATVTVLYPADLPITDRVQLLADALAA